MIRYETFKADKFELFNFYFVNRLDIHYINLTIILFGRRICLDYYDKIFIKILKEVFNKKED